MIGTRGMAKRGFESLIVHAACTYSLATVPYILCIDRSFASFLGLSSQRLYSNVQWRTKYVPDIHISMGLY